MDDPIRLLQEIKKICLNYNGVTHPCGVLQNTISGLSSLKQLEGKKIADYTDRIKSRVQAMMTALLDLMVAKSHGMKTSPSQKEILSKRKYCRSVEAKVSSHCLKHIDDYSRDLAGVKASKGNISYI